MAYDFITLTGLASGVAMARGSTLGRAGVVTYGVWMTAFTAFKVGYIHGWRRSPSAWPASLLLALTRSARRYVNGE